MMFFFSLWACSTSAPADLSSPALVASIAEEITASPTEADQILERHGTDRSSFEAALFDIAADEARTAEYLEARK